MKYLILIIFVACLSGCADRRAIAEVLMVRSCICGCSFFHEEVKTYMDAESAKNRCIESCKTLPYEVSKGMNK